MINISIYVYYIVKQSRPKAATDTKELIRQVKANQFSNWPHILWFVIDVNTDVNTDFESWNISISDRPTHFRAWRMCEICNLSNKLTYQIFEWHYSFKKCRCKKKKLIGIINLNQISCIFRLKLKNIIFQSKNKIHCVYLFIPLSQALLITKNLIESDFIVKELKYELYDEFPFFVLTYFIHKISLILNSAATSPKKSAQSRTSMSYILHIYCTYNIKPCYFIHKTRHLGAKRPDIFITTMRN